MSDLSAFESVFRRALRNRFEYQEVSLKTILIITDLDEENEQGFRDNVRRYLSATMNEGKPGVGDHGERTVYALAAT